ncbi:MAG TPA: decaprenyl-phosphate phosphoribosyltransferase [Ignavibacteriaceae bacterium]|nr:decaprenyl-phosphate phosphoribosyltransferase [Ignavibacteriaceae bacterium]
MLKQYLILFRIPQWIKNLFVFVPLIFSQNLFNSHYLLKTLHGFLLFCLTSSVVYIINDIIDIEADRAHPEKQKRPLASGKISKTSGIIAGAVLSLLIILQMPFFPLLFNGSIIFYFLLNFFYSISLKHIVILDVFIIAAGFMLRVIAGAFVIDVEISSWLILTTMFISLFLGVMKRHSELQISALDSTVSTRKVLVHYSTDFTSQMATTASAGVIICYALYTVAERTVSVFGTENLIYTTPFVVFGIFRYMYLVYLGKKGENTSEIIVSDLPMIINILLYFLAVTLILYKIF